LTDIGVTTRSTCSHPVMDLDIALEKYFGMEAFRPFQREIIECVMAGESALAVLPTGGGKSLCFQLPALLLPGVTLVISPLISLMKDQVDTLVSKGISAVAVNSHDTVAEMYRKLNDIATEQVRLVYVAPERLKSAGFIRVCRQLNISLLAVDEAHCVSQWGHDFRPDYGLIKDFRKDVGQPPMLALTATATKRVQQDISRQLGIEKAKQFFAAVDRPNLWLGIEHCQTMIEKQGKVVALARRAPGSTIVYVSSRNDADLFATVLEDALGEPVAAYHAGLSAAERTMVQNRFMAGMVRVVTATNAFGMGIDKADIRAVIHAGVPDSIEAYFQEIGRAGRDGEPAECTMVVTPGRDVKLREFLLEKDTLTQAQVHAFLRKTESLVGSGEGIIPFGEDDAAMGTLILSYLQAQERLELVHRTNTGMQVSAVQPMDSDVYASIWNQVQHQTQAKQERFRAMRSFVYLNSCRRAHLLRYFGENVTARNAACCSVCHPRSIKAYAVAKPTVNAKRKALPSKAESEVHPELLQRLKNWRRTQAEVKNVPAYVIFGDKELIGIAGALPRTLDQLAACYGVGPTKLELYGADIISIVTGVMGQAQDIRQEAATRFAAGKSVSETALELDCAESVAWDAFLTWVVSTSDETWKMQVRRLLDPQIYISIRTELRQRRQESFDKVLSQLQQRFTYKEITLTRAVMDKVEDK
jgi:ATP-dependent DNA helicase RecQ